MENWTPKYWQDNENQCSELLKDEAFWNQVPNLNTIPNSQLKDGLFVRYRGMIQDMMNPVFYFDKYEVIDQTTLSKHIESGRFKEYLSCQESEELLMDSSNNVNDERRSLYCISIPGLNTWAKPTPAKPSTIVSSQPVQPSQSESCKRLQSDESSQQSNKRVHVDVDSEMITDAKPSKESDKEKKISIENSLMDLNLPFPDDSATACLVTIYQNLDSYLVNQVIEVVGFLCVDPPPLKSDPDEEMMDQEHMPPTSLVPRLHATLVKTVPHSNPLLGPQVSDQSLEDVTSVRKDLKLLLTQLLMGDDVAADYFICYLLSKVYWRDDVSTALGKFSLNIFHKDLATSCTDYAKMLYDVLKLLVCKSHYFQLNIMSLNETTMIPRKDYSSNRLKSGLLQLSDSTYLLLDEIHLQPGQLDNTGCLNVKALSSVVTSQRMSYDFQFYDGTFPTDIPILALSDTKSVIPSDCHIKLKPDPSCSSVIKETFSAAHQYLKPELLSSIRRYITWAQNRDFNIPELCTEIIQRDFVNLRKENKNVDANDLHTLIVLARLMCLSHGHTELSQDMWKQALAMEMERRSR